MAILAADGTSVVAPVILYRQVTLGALEYHIITDAGIQIDINDPNSPGGTGVPLAYAVGYLWPRGDGTPGAA